MLSKFLADCDGYAIHSQHIQHRHFFNASPRASYFTIRFSKLIRRIHSILTGRTLPVYYLREGSTKIIVWARFSKPIGLYRKGNYLTRTCAIVITKNNNWATIRTAYPDRD